MSPARGQVLALGGHHPDTGAGPGRPVAQLQAGRSVLEAYQPEAGLLLASWKGREGELLERMSRARQGEDAGLPRGLFEAGSEACRIGGALEREASAGRIRVPESHKGLERDLQTASARIEASGLRPPFPGDTLKALAPATLRSALEDLRRGGMLTEGPEWALRKDQAPLLAESLHKTLQKHLEADLQVSDPPGRR